MISWDASPTLDRAARYLPTPGEEGGTRYSMVCDLVGGIVDVYLDGDFSRRARLDGPTLWSEGHERVLLAELPFKASEVP